MDKESSHIPRASRARHCSIRCSESEHFWIRLTGTPLVRCHHFTKELRIRWSVIHYQRNHSICCNTDGLPCQHADVFKWAKGSKGKSMRVEGLLIAYCYIRYGLNGLALSPWSSPPFDKPACYSYHFIIQVSSSLSTPTQSREKYRQDFRLFHYLVKAPASRWHSSSCPARPPASSEDPPWTSEKLSRSFPCFLDSDWSSSSLRHCQWECQSHHQWRGTRSRRRYK